MPYSEILVFRSRYTYAVALQSDEIYGHGNGPVTVSVQCFDIIQQVSKELIASFEHTERYDVMASHLLHHISRKPLGPTDTQSGI